VHKPRVGANKRHPYQHGLTDALHKPAADESNSTTNTQIRSPPERMADHGLLFMLASVSTPAPAIMLTMIMLP
jgi:hypothetical protein